MNGIEIRYPDIIRFLASPAGQLLIWLIAVPLLLRNGVPAVVLAALALTMLLPDHRRAVLSVASVVLLLRYLVPADITATAISWQQHAVPAATASVILLGICYGLYKLASRSNASASILARFPQTFLHLGAWLVLAVLFFVPKSPTLLLTAALLPSIVWAAAYMFAAGRRNQLKGTGFGDHLFYLIPFHTLGSALILGKGHDYLGRHEATNSSQRVKAQLAGLKLLFLAVAWSVSLDLMEAIAYRPDDNWYASLLPEIGVTLPRLEELIGQQVMYGVPTAWASLLLHFIGTVLQLAIWSHVAIALLRLAGFNVFRNTYRPLLAESIVDFWARLSYYFKEICVDFFFYPVFLRSSWARPELRLFLAIFSAAFIGNLYWHVLYGAVWLITWDVETLSDFFVPRLLYTTALAAGVWISMLRQQHSRQLRSGRSLPGRFRRIAGVWLFYSLLHIWNIDLPGAGNRIASRFTFMRSLFGL